MPICARVLMTDDERRCIAEGARLKNFSKMDDARFDATDVCPVNSDEPILRIEQDDEEDFTVIVLNEAFGDT